jgi:hypothetical protein
VPQRWDPVEYRKRATAWRNKAASLVEDQPERALCLELAEAYEKLALQLEQLAAHRNKCPEVDDG